MAHVKRDERYVEVGYEITCGYQRATALANDLNATLKSDSGFQDAKDDTRLWDGNNMSLVVVTYNTLADAIRLDAKVRSELSRKVEYTYEYSEHISYGRHGGHSKINARTTLLAS